VPISNVVWRRVAKYGGKMTPATHATVVPLRSRTGGVRVVTIVVHMPTRSTVLRRRAWASCINGLVKLVKQIRKADPKAQVVLCWDVNADWFNARDRALLEKAAKRLDLSPAWGWPMTGTIHERGTHGSRLIDAIWTDAEVHDAEVLGQTRASDHRPIRAVLNITRKRADA
jgi:endonuclease/exonuclease/phosphatase family metal-dependent hydrolase